MQYRTRDYRDTLSIGSCCFVEHSITSYIKSKCSVAVIGLSGGADSTLVAALCVKALGKENVYGISMPHGDTDRETFNSRSEKLASRLGINHKTVSICHVASEIDICVSEFVSRTTSDLSSGNARSRARMAVLYGVAGMLNEIFVNQSVRVIGTGNLSEDFIGYDTKGGDALADFFPIGQLYKQEVYDMLDYLIDTRMIDEEHVDRVPSAGLWEGQTDETELGYKYNDMAPSIEYFLHNPNLLENCDPVTELSWSEVTRFVRKRHLANNHKHIAPPVCPLKTCYK